MNTRQKQPLFNVKDVIMSQLGLKIGSHVIDRCDPFRPQGLLFSLTVLHSHPLNLGCVNSSPDKPLKSTTVNLAQGPWMQNTNHRSV